MVGILVVFWDWPIFRTFAVSFRDVIDFGGSEWQCNRERDEMSFLRLVPPKLSLVDRTTDSMRGHYMIFTNHLFPHQCLAWPIANGKPA